jgi:Bifunctional DNA primase/polymerase, N-terminal
MSLGEELRDAALAAGAASWRVLPCCHWSKVPAIRRWPGKATTDERQLRAWWDGVKLFNLAALTGYPGPDVVDFDVRADGDGWAAFHALKEAGLLAGSFRMVRTPSTGVHLYFAGSGQRSGSIKGAHLDFKARGGCVMLPPSVVGGIRYEVIDQRPQTGVTFDWEAAKQLLCPAPAYRPPRQRRQGGGRHHGSGSLVWWLEEQFEGNRNSGLFWACCRALEADDDETLGDLADVALSVGLSDAEVRWTIESARRETNNGR